MIEVGKYSIVSLQEAVESAKEMLRLQDTTEFDGFLLRKADEAMRHIGDDTTYAKRACTLDIIDGRAKLPMGFIRLLGARMSDSNGNCFEQPYLDLPYLTDCGCENMQASITDSITHSKYKRDISSSTRLQTLKRKQYVSHTSQGAWTMTG